MNHFNAYFASPTNGRVGACLKENDRIVLLFSFQKKQIDSSYLLGLFPLPRSEAGTLTLHEERVCDYEGAQRTKKHNSPSVY